MCTGRPNQSIPKNGPSGLQTHLELHTVFFQELLASFTAIQALFTKRGMKQNMGWFELVACRDEKMQGSNDLGGQNVADILLNRGSPCHNSLNQQATSCMTSHCGSEIPWNIVDIFDKLKQLSVASGGMSSSSPIPRRT